MSKQKNLRLRVFRLHSFPLGGMGHVVMCCHCKQILFYDKMTVEHVRPKALGGTDAISNLLPSCAPCNNQRPCEDITQSLAPLLKSRRHKTNNSPRNRKASKRVQKAAGTRISTKKPKKKNVNRKWFIPNP